MRVRIQKPSGSSVGHRPTITGDGAVRLMYSRLPDSTDTMHNLDQPQDTSRLEQHEAEGLL